MSEARRSLAFALVFLLQAGLGGGGVPAVATASEPATMSFWSVGTWQPLWWADRTPEHWESADTSFTGALEWQPLAPGVDWARMSAGLWKSAGGLTTHT